MPDMQPEIPWDGPAEAPPPEPPAEPPTQEEPPTFDPSNWYLSQSTFKDYLMFRKREMCGEVFRLKNLLKDPRFERQDTEEMKAGRYFEMLATGYVNPKEGEVQPERYKVATERAKKGDLKPAFENAKKQAENFFKVLEGYGMEIVCRGKMVYDKRRRIRGLIDVIAKLPNEEGWGLFMGRAYNFDGMKVMTIPPYESCIYVDDDGVEHHGCIIIDLKYSGLLHNRWVEGGWESGMVAEDASHRIQALTYSAMLNLPFFYLVFSSKNTEVLFFRMEPRNDTKNLHMKAMGEALNMILVTEELGDFTDHRDGNLVYFPSYNRCLECPLAETCKHYERIPKPQLEYIDRIDYLD